jgi:hypothetical protein
MNGGDPSRLCIVVCIETGLMRQRPDAVRCDAECTVAPAQKRPGLASVYRQAFHGSRLFHNNTVCRAAGALSDTDNRSALDAIALVVKPG